jgi:hypothetical protein
MPFLFAISCISLQEADFLKNSGLKNSSDPINALSHSYLNASMGSSLEAFWDSQSLNLELLHIHINLTSFAKF